MAHPDIVIVSHGRAGRVRTLGILPDGVPWIAVAESQAPLYRAAHPDARLMVHPDEVVGLPAKRQWIYEQCGNVFMLDDDVQSVECYAAQEKRRVAHVYRTPKAWRGRRTKFLPPSEYVWNRKLSPEEFESVIARAHDTAVDLGLYLYGFTDGAHPMAYPVHKPFRLTGYIHGNGMGLVEGSGLWFDTSITMFEDVWMGALNASKHRICLQDQRYSLALQQTGKALGGMAHVRTERSMIEDGRILRRAFGDVIVRRRQGIYGAEEFNTNLWRYVCPFGGSDGGDTDDG